MRPTAMFGMMSATMVVMALAGLSACGASKTNSGVHPVVGSDLPAMPMPLVGEASLGGTVRDAAGNPLAGVTVKVAETDAVTATGADGVYHLTVPSDSTITVSSVGTGFASTYRESIVVADQAVVANFDMFMLPTADITRMNALAGGSGTTPTGLMAVRLHSLTDSCALTGAKISVWPPKTATVMYSRPSATGGLDEPDLSMPSVQAGVRVDAWLTAGLLPGNMVQLTVEQTGCTVVSPSPSMGGIQYPGLRRFDADALTVTDLFLN